MNEEEEGPSDSNSVIDYFSMTPSDDDKEDEFSYANESTCHFMWRVDAGGHYSLESRKKASLHLECYNDNVRELEMESLEECLIVEAGKKIGDSLVLKKVYINLSQCRRDDVLAELFQGMAHNRSIELLKLRLNLYEPEPDMFQGLIPFFEYNVNLRCIELYRAKSWTLNSLSLALSQCNNSQLKRINLINPRVSDKSMSEFFASLINVHSVSELCLEWMHLGKMGGEALANLFTNPASNIQSLYA